jgi:hypothetical protein
MKKIIFAIAIVAALYLGFSQTGGTLHFKGATTVQSDQLASAFSEHRSGAQVTGAGVVTKVLSDDNDGSRHQRFILSLPSGQTLLFAHNIDLAPRLESLKSGDSVEFNGVYEWNAKGGVVHWTHHDPSGQHPAGWLKHGGQTFQ